MLVPFSPRIGRGWLIVGSVRLASRMIWSAAMVAAVWRALEPAICSEVSPTTFWTSTTARAARPATAATMSSHSSVVRPLSSAALGPAPSGGPTLTLGGGLRTLR